MRGLGVIAYDKRNGTCQLIENMRFIFANSIPLTIKSQIFCYYPSDARWLMYHNLGVRPAMRSLATPNCFTQGPALAYAAKLMIYLTGGLEYKSKKVMHECLRYDI